MPSARPMYEVEREERDTWGRHAPGLGAGPAQPRFGSADGGDPWSRRPRALASLGALEEAAGRRLHGFSKGRELTPKLVALSDDERQEAIDEGGQAGEEATT